MTITEIQKRVDALGAAMLTKALREPKAEFSIGSNVETQVCLNWRTNPTGGGMFDYKWFRGPAESALAEADAWVAALPSPEEARMQEFMGSLAATIELGKKADIDVAHVNPLIALMKRLSKNALRHTPAEATP